MSDRRVAVDPRRAASDNPKANSPDRFSRVRAALAYVPHVARKYMNCGIPYDELLAAGNLGLVEAALRFEPSRNVKFVTYADWWIRKSILKVLEEQTGPVRLPRYRQQQLRRIREGRKTWIRRHGTEPDARQLARTTGLSLDELHRLRRFGRVSLSLEDPASPGSRRSVADCLVDEADRDPHDRLIEHDFAAHLRDLVAALSPKESKVLELRFGMGGGEPLTLRAVGDRLGISRERVRQLEHRALGRLRAKIDA